MQKERCGNVGFSRNYSLPYPFQNPSFPEEGWFTVAHSRNVALTVPSQDLYSRREYDIYHCLFPENHTHRKFLNSSFAEKAYGLPLAIPGILYSLYIREHAIPGEKKKVCHYLTLIQIIILNIYP